MKKEWRDVVGYEGHYRVSSHGEVVGPKGTVLQTPLNGIISSSESESPPSPSK